MECRQSARCQHIYQSELNTFAAPTLVVWHFPVQASGLEEQADDLAEYVFPGPGKAGHRVDLKKPWAAICKAADITGLRVHDLRHSYASLLVSAGHGLPVVGALLGHTQASTTHRYAHLFDEVTRKATGQVGALVRGAGKRSAKVVKLPSRT